jgi:hypothetical protein
MYERNDMLLQHMRQLMEKQGAILGLGIISAGTNNSRVAGLLRYAAIMKTNNYLVAMGW